MEIVAKGLPSSYEIEHLARLFFPAAPLRKAQSTRGNLCYARLCGGRLVAGVRQDGGIHLAYAPATGDWKADRLTLSRLLYDLLRAQTGTRPPWGMLTGVRPVRLLRRALGEGEAAGKRALQGVYDVCDEKYALIQGIVRRQQPVLQATEAALDYSLYISIPFCPTRCSYCSYVSRTIEREGHLIEPYLAALGQELQATARLAEKLRLRLRTLYIGGGTPTSLSAPQLERLLCMIADNFPTASLEEYSLEAGRPDCTDLTKLQLAHSFGVGRVSVNPQSMCDEVLQAIGRRHAASDILRCFADARTAGFANINMDLIAGLPADSEAGFAETLRQVLALGPENITLHTLVLKRASTLVQQHDTETASSPGAMLAAAYPRLAAEGYVSYYLYRQKSTVDNLENTGWALPGCEGLYNIYIMEEAHSILAVGAGASTKLVSANGQRIERLFAPKFPVDYIRNIQQVLDKKKEVAAFYAGSMDSQTVG